MRLLPLHAAHGEVIVEERFVKYDYLVLAVGGVSNDFHTPGIEHCYFLDSRQEAEDFHRTFVTHLYNLQNDFTKNQ